MDPYYRAQKRLRKPDPYYRAEKERRKPKLKPVPKNPPIEPGARLSAIVERLRGGGLVAAETMTADLAVGVSTIYRDIQTLRETGVPIDGTRGAGFRLRETYLVPALTFTFDEIEAIELGTRLVQAWDRTSLGAAAEDALVKIEAVLPCRLKAGDRKDAMPVFAAPGSTLTPDEKARHTLLRRAIRGRRRVRFRHVMDDGFATDVRIEPLSLVFWKSVWRLFGWSEAAAGFAGYETRRLGDLRLGERFPIVEGRRIEDFLGALKRKA